MKLYTQADACDGRAPFVEVYNRNIPGFTLQLDGEADLFALLDRGHVLVELPITRLDGSSIREDWIRAERERLPVVFSGFEWQFEDEHDPDYYYYRSSFFLTVIFQDEPLRLGEIELWLYIPGESALGRAMFAMGAVSNLPETD